MSSGTGRSTASPQNAHQLPQQHLQNQNLQMNQNQATMVNQQQQRAQMLQQNQNQNQNQFNQQQGGMMNNGQMQNMTNLQASMIDGVGMYQQIPDAELISTAKSMIPKLNTQLRTTEAVSQFL